MALAIAAPILAATATTATNLEEPSSSPKKGLPVVQGCFKSNGNLTYDSAPVYNSKGGCAKDTCLAKGYMVAGTTKGTLCYCGNSYPPSSDRVDDSQCSTPCIGYPLEACGSDNTWTIYNTGKEIVVDGENLNSPTTSSSTTQATAVVTVSGSTVVITASSTPESETKSSTNVAGIAAGVVVGVVALVGGLGAAFLVMRRRRNREIEEEHRRNAAVNAFINGSKPPGSSGSMSLSDQRLDPVMAQRRLSSGSIADNQDYSRRILRVTNA